MDLEGLLAFFFGVIVAFILGMIKGSEDEQDRIRRAFEAEDYNYERFSNVLEKYEKPYQKKEREKRKLKEYILLLIIAICLGTLFYYFEVTFFS